MRQQKAE